MCCTTHNDVLRDQIRCKCYWLLLWGFFSQAWDVANSPPLLLSLLSILITSVWLRHPGFSRLFRGTQKALRGNHSALLTDGSIAPAPTITANWGHSLSCHCSLSAHIQNKYTWKYTGAQFNINARLQAHTAKHAHTPTLDYKGRKCCCKRTATKKQQAQHHVNFLGLCWAEFLFLFLLPVDKYPSFLHFSGLDLLSTARGLTLTLFANW